jgi:hypothetical protein
MIRLTALSGEPIFIHPDLIKVVTQCSEKEATWLHHTYKGLSTHIFLGKEYGGQHVRESAVSIVAMLADLKKESKLL